MDRERAVPMREDAMFRIKSMTKPIIAAALLMLMEESRIALADEVATFIPARRDLRVFTGGYQGAFDTRACARPMRVIDLVTHTSGLIHGDLLNTAVDAACLDLKIADRNTPGRLARDDCPACQLAA